MHGRFCLLLFHKENCFCWSCSYLFMGPAIASARVNSGMQMLDIYMKLHVGKGVRGGTVG
jgi:hypothetical protein